MTDGKEELGAVTYMDVFNGNETQAVRSALISLRKGTRAAIDRCTDLHDRLSLAIDAYGQQKEGTIGGLSQESLDNLYELIELVRKDMLTDTPNHPKFLMPRNADQFLFDRLHFKRDDVEAIYRGQPDMPDLAAIKD